MCYNVTVLRLLVISFVYTVEAFHCCMIRNKLTLGWSLYKQYVKGVSTVILSLQSMGVCFCPQSNDVSLHEDSEICLFQIFSLYIYFYTLHTFLL